MRRLLAAAFVLLLTPGCDSGAGAGADAGVDAGQLCDSDFDCPSGFRCAYGGVHEAYPEPGETLRCTPADQVIGGSPATWDWRPGGRPLAERLCTAQGITSSSSASAPARRARQQELLARLGTRMIRLDLTWRFIEPSPGAFDFTGYEAMVDAADASGLAVIGILAYGTPWATAATDDDDKFPPDDPADYASYAAEVATYFAGRIEHFELWNEPNAGYRFFKPTANGDAAHYADLVAAAAGAIRGVCPGCTVWAGSIFFHEQLINGGIEFIHDLLTARPDAFDQLDGFAWHPYALYPPQAAPEHDGDGERAVGGMVADLRALFSLHGLAADFPLAITEFGWPVYSEVTEEVQARFFARSFLLGASLGNDPLCWFNVTDGPDFGGFPPEDDFGLYRYGSEDPASAIDPKPAGLAVTWLATVGSDAVPAGPNLDAAIHDPTRGRFALDFDTPAGTLTVLWRVSGSEAIQLQPELRTAYDLAGTEIATPVGDALDVTVGESPVYLVP